MRRSVAELFGQDDGSLLRRISAGSKKAGEIHTREGAAFDDDLKLYARDAETDNAFDFRYSF